MIVDFIEVKRALDKTAHLFLRAEIRKRMPFVSQIGVIPQHEGSDASYETVDRQVQEIEYQLTTSEPVTLTRDEMAGLSLAEVEQLLLKLAEDLAHKIERTALEKMGQIPFEPPNVKGWPGTFDGRKWINTATLLARYNLAIRLVDRVRGRLPDRPDPEAQRDDRHRTPRKPRQGHSWSRPRRDASYTASDRLFAWSLR